MSRFQQLALLILALILFAVVALVAVTALRQTTQTTVVVTATFSVSSEDATVTERVAELFDHMTQDARITVTPASGG